MLIPQNPLIVCLGIVMSFFLFYAGQKINLETTDLGAIQRGCQTIRLDFEKCVVRRDSEIIRQYGVSYLELEARKRNQMIFLIIPAVILITALFVSFTATKKEILLTVFTLSPLFLSFIGFYPYAPEKLMIPVYLTIAVVLAFFFSRGKKKLAF